MKFIRTVGPPIGFLFFPMRFFFFPFDLLFSPRDIFPVNPKGLPTKNIRLFMLTYQF